MKTALPKKNAEIDSLKQRLERYRGTQGTEHLVEWDGKMARVL